MPCDAQTRRVLTIYAGCRYLLFVRIKPSELVLFIIRMAFVVMTHVWRQRVVLQPLWAYQYAAPIPKIAW